MKLNPLFLLALVVTASPSLFVTAQPELGGPVVPVIPGPGGPIVPGPIGPGPLEFGGPIVPDAPGLGGPMIPARVLPAPMPPIPNGDPSAPPVPLVYLDPHPPVPPGAWWIGALVPVVHQRTIYYPSWDVPVRVLVGITPPGTPALDIPQSRIPPYWKRYGQ